MSISEENKTDSSTSESEVSELDPIHYNPLKALYSDKVKSPPMEVPFYENIVQFEAAQKKENEIIAFGNTKLVTKRAEEKEKKRVEEEKLLEQKNKQRFAKYADLAPKREFKVKNVLTRMDTMDGPLAILKEYVEKRLRVKIITRTDRDVRGVLYATIVAFDKHWNLALADVLEVWKRKTWDKRKIMAGLGTPVPKGTAATIASVPVVTVSPVPGNKRISECWRHIPQVMVRGEHIVLVYVMQQ